MVAVVISFMAFDAVVFEVVGNSCEGVDTVQSVAPGDCINRVRTRMRRMLSRAPFRRLGGGLAADGRGERGQAAFEFLLILPLFVLFILLLIDFGIVMYGYVSVSNAAREGARFASVNCGDGHLHAGDDSETRSTSASSGFLDNAGRHRRRPGRPDTRRQRRGNARLACTTSCSFRRRIDIASMRRDALRAGDDGRDASRRDRRLMPPRRPPRDVVAPRRSLGHGARAVSGRGGQSASASCCC